MKLFVASGFFLAVFVLSDLQSTTAHAQAEFQQQAPHVHGTARLTLVQDRSTLLIEFESPAINIVGFEHAPQNPSQRLAIEEAIQTLEASDSVLLLSALDCEIVQTWATLTGEFSELSHDHDHDHDHDDNHAHEHAGFRVIFELACLNEPAPTELGITAFATFQGIQTIEAQWALDRNQGARRLPNNVNRLRLDL